ncbi:hypothetical protein BJY04DRAFT_179089 [Aspergillus karnatakaensis]|uniref:uncharacterized protein n=1 Tax=Aspergillus karnatakaensis TaxID=1810916 RepID=UPI003CCE0F54
MNLLWLLPSSPIICISIIAHICGHVIRIYGFPFYCFLLWTIMYCIAAFDMTFYADTSLTVKLCCYWFPAIFWAGVIYKKPHILDGDEFKRIDTILQSRGLSFLATINRRLDYWVTPKVDRHLILTYIEIWKTLLLIIRHRDIFKDNDDEPLEENQRPPTSMTDEELIERDRSRLRPDVADVIERVKAIQDQILRMDVWKRAWAQNMMLDFLSEQRRRLDDDKAAWTAIDARARSVFADTKNRRGRG